MIYSYEELRLLARLKWHVVVTHVNGQVIQGRLDWFYTAAGRRHFREVVTMHGDGGMWSRDKVVSTVCTPYDKMGKKLLRLLNIR
jgi:hypothetical protein